MIAAIEAFQFIRYCVLAMLLSCIRANGLHRDTRAPWVGLFGSMGLERIEDAHYDAYWGMSGRGPLRYQIARRFEDWLWDSLGIEPDPPSDEGSLV